MLNGYFYKKSQPGSAIFSDSRSADHWNALRNLLDLCDLKFCLGLLDFGLTI
jgi:hypothetical protein